MCSSEVANKGLSTGEGGDLLGPLAQGNGNTDQECAYPLKRGGGGAGLMWRTHPPAQDQKNWPLGRNEILYTEPQMRGPF